MTFITCNTQVIEIRPATKAYNGSDIIMDNGDGVSDVSSRKPTVVIIMIGRKKWGLKSLSTASVISRREEIPFSSRIVPSGLSVAEGP